MGRRKAPMGRAYRRNACPDARLILGAPRADTDIAMTTCSTTGRPDLSAHSSGTHPITPPDPVRIERIAAAGPRETRAAGLSRLIHWMAESRSHRVICLVLGIWLLNGFDLMFTILSHEQGLLHEENPVARLMLGYGTTSIVLFKTGLVLIGSYPLLRFRRARITELGTYVILIAYALLALRWSTCYELYDFSIANGLGFTGSEALIAPGGN